MWIVPPIATTKVILNPEGRNYEEYKEQSEGLAGYIVGAPSEGELARFDSWSDRKKRSTMVTVQWLNGNVYNYILQDLLAIDVYTNFTTYVFLDGSEYRVFDGDSYEKVDYKLITEGTRLHKKVTYDEEYRKRIWNQQPLDDFFEF